jgi:hypothetical protein
MSFPTSTTLRSQDASARRTSFARWIEVDDGEIVDHGQPGRSLIGDGPELEAPQVCFSRRRVPGDPAEPEARRRLGPLHARPSAAASAGRRPGPSAGRPYCSTSAPFFGVGRRSSS